MNYNLKNSILVHLAENNNISQVNLLGDDYISNNVKILRFLLKKLEACYLSLFGSCSAKNE